MPWRGSFLVMSFWCSGGFLYLDGHLFIKSLEIFFYYFVEYFTYNFDLHLFSLFNADDLQVWSLDGVAGFLYIPLTALETFF
jgi:hypothetical protein